MEKERYIIPRNVLSKEDTLPLDFIVHFELEKRQLPYLLIGTSFLATAFINPTLTLVYKIAIPAIGFGGSIVLSSIKTEGQHIENIVMNIVRYEVFKRKLKKYNKGDVKSVNKNFKSRIFKLAIKEK